MPPCPMPQIDGSQARISEGGEVIGIQFRNIGQDLAKEALEKSRSAQSIVPVCIVPHAMLDPEFSQVLRNTPDDTFRVGLRNSSYLVGFTSRLKKFCCGHSYPKPRSENEPILASSAESTSLCLIGSVARSFGAVSPYQDHVLPERAVYSRNRLAVPWTPERPDARPMASSEDSSKCCETKCRRKTVDLAPCERPQRFQSLRHHVFLIFVLPRRSNRRKST